MIERSAASALDGDSLTNKKIARSHIGIRQRSKNQPGQQAQGLPSRLVTCRHRPLPAKRKKNVLFVFPSCTFRFSDYKFRGPEGFFLNGRHYKLHGVNRHQDLAPLGPALPDEAHRRDVELMKEAGANFVRLAHYPQDDAVLRECDRAGLLVWEEIPVVNLVVDHPDFDNNAESALVDMIRQHYNHPSVIGWGYMNEVLLAEPRPVRQEVRDRTLALALRLEKKLHEEDPSRASFTAFGGANLYNDAGLGITDAVGWNLYQGWYGGDLTGFERYLERQREMYPHRSLIISEWGAGSDRRLHSDAPVPFDFSTEYQQKTCWLN